MQNDNIIVIKFVIRWYCLFYDSMFDVKIKNKVILMRVYDEKLDWICVIII